MYVIIVSQSGEKDLILVFGGIVAARGMLLRLKGEDTRGLFTMRMQEADPADHVLEHVKSETMYKK